MSRRQLLPLVLAFTAFLIPLSGCGRGEEPPPAVLLIVVDTLRADRLGSYGNTRGLTPRLDRLAAEGALFEQAHSHAPWTLPSVASLLTSRLPLEHGAGGSLDLSSLERGGGATPRFRALDPSIETLPERFLAAGYRTASVINVDFLGSDFGLTQGFEHVDEQWFRSNQQVRRATQTTDAALSWLGREGRRPFFLMVHYFDPHAVYDPPAEFRRRFAAPVDRESSAFVFGTREHMLLLRSGRLELDPALIERAERLYDGEVAYVDHEIGRLLDEMSARGLLDDTIVVVTSDHGEEFLEHGGFEHGHTLYQELVRVPLIVHAPGRVPPVSVPERVGLVDVAPTLCELAGIAPPRAISGSSLVPRMRGEGPVGPGPVLAHGNFWGPPLESAILGPHKLIVPGTLDAHPELYDLDQDSGEQHDLRASRPELLARMAELLERARAAQEAHSRGVELELDAERIDRLRGLGYAGGEQEAEPPEGAR